MTEFSVVVIGAGQAGLAVAYFLKKAGVSFVVVDRNSRVGQSWKDRYDSLRLFTPQTYDALPGLTLSGDEGDYPTKDKIADYLEQYAEKFRLPVELNTRVFQLKKTSAGFMVATNKGMYRAQQVVVATGAFQSARIPFVEGNKAGVLELHSSEYKNPSKIPQGSVLIVGAGNSGAQIAVELSQTHRVSISVRKPLKFLPSTILGKSIFWWMGILRLFETPADSMLGKKLQQREESIIGTRLKSLIKHKRVLMRPEITHLSNREAVFIDGSKEHVDAIVWATGYRHDFSWIHIDGALDANGYPLHDEGKSPIRGLYFMGLSWQFARDSALLHGVGRDAQRISTTIMATDKR